MDDARAECVVLDEEADDDIPAVAEGDSLDVVEEEPAKRELDEEDHDQAALVERLSNGLTDLQSSRIIKRFKRCIERPSTPRHPPAGQVPAAPARRRMPDRHVAIGWHGTPWTWALAWAHGHAYKRTTVTQLIPTDPSSGGQQQSRRQMRASHAQGCLARPPAWAAHSFCRSLLPPLTSLPRRRSS